MRVRHWLFGVSSGLLVLGLTVGGCSGTEVAAPGADAGKDVVADTTQPPAADSGPDVVADSATPACMVDADLTMLNIPDADIADGASTIGLCASCVDATCKMQLSACNDDCDCKSAVVDFFICYGGGGSITKCGLPLATLGGEAQMLGQQLLVCIDPAFAGLPGPGCITPCAVNALIPSDAGKDAPSDAPTDG